MAATLCYFLSFLHAEDILIEMPSAKIADSVIIQLVALGSCFAPQIESDIWSDIAEYNPDVFLYLGDNVYQSKETDDMALPHLKMAYRLLAEVQSFSTFRYKTPILPIWDDHDFSMNDAGGSWPAKYESEKLFEQVWAIPEDDPRRSRDGIYFSQTFGQPGQRVQTIMLDTRFFRSDIYKIKLNEGEKRY
jgi:alkaline phosphatase D